ncbi:Pex12 amino terminal region-domain-containing protein [Chaetomium strumarium]|uniref:RING-type E3 ubiquitin transferase n=1 Tax=Chaetomium strumarium TaxID=1170767 RepID=A0AAJ0M5G3_9PEZI|nr:Pex12 amino terminal region-domain-containing protein [Chaetomium strumarium]
MASSQPPQSRPPPPLTSSPYPFAAAPDIIRANQKDAYFQGVLSNQLSDLHRRLRGARSAHAWATETRTFADALYLCLTTLLGNRTLGEEYCDLVQVEAPPHSSNSTDKQQQQQQPPTSFPQTSSSSDGPVLPSLPRRFGSILSSTLLPYLASLLLPRLRSTLRKRLQSRLAALTRQGRDEKRDKSGRPSTEYRVLRYLLAHLTPLTSGAHFHAVTLAVFYFTGAYYSLSKRVFGLRYVFTKRVEENQGGRGGYEVLGVLLVVQMAVRAYLHVREQLTAGSYVVPGEEEEDGSLFREREAGFRPSAAAFVDVSLSENAYTSNNELLGLQGAGAGSSSQRGLAEIAAATHTPVPKGGRPRYDLGSGEKIMGWIKGAQQRKCTLCLEELKDPAATQCGHVFCWACIGDWVKEKPECPLCRREAMVQHILPLRVA